jgi:putative tryptophan/tyrosine transport system substrate-binding protein
VIAGSLLATPLAAEAQQTGEVYRIGVLELVGVASNAANLSAFREGLAELGYVEGQNFAIEYRSAHGMAGLSGSRTSRPSWFGSRLT